MGDDDDSYFCLLIRRHTGWEQDPAIVRFRAMEKMNNVVAKFSLNPRAVWPHFGSADGWLVVTYCLPNDAHAEVYASPEVKGVLAELKAQELTREGGRVLVFRFPDPDGDGELSLRTLFGCRDDEGSFNANDMRISARKFEAFAICDEVANAHPDKTTRALYKENCQFLHTRWRRLFPATRKNGVKKFRLAQQQVLSFLLMGVPQGTVWEEWIGFRLLWMAQPSPDLNVGAGPHMRLNQTFLRTTPVVQGLFKYKQILEHRIANPPVVAEVADAEAEPGQALEFGLPAPPVDLVAEGVEPVKAFVQQRISQKAGGFVKTAAAAVALLQVCPDLAAGCIQPMVSIGKRLSSPMREAGGVYVKARRGYLGAEMV